MVIEKVSHESKTGQTLHDMPVYPNVLCITFQDSNDDEEDPSHAQVLYRGSHEYMVNILTEMCKQDKNLRNIILGVLVKLLIND